MAKCSCDCHCFGGCQGFTRVILMAINIFFLGAGVLIVIFASVSIGKAAQFEQQSNLFQNMDTRVSCAILIATGAGTIAVAIMGFVAVTFRWTTTLKLYTVIMFLVCTLQLAMGIFLYTRNPDKIMGDLWFDPTAPGIATRVAYQNFLSCCGWYNTIDTQTDAWGPTTCPVGYIWGYEDGLAGAWPPCLPATQKWLKSYIIPLAEAAVVLAVFQFVALSGSCFIIMVSKKDGDDFYSSPYHY